MRPIVKMLSLAGLIALAGCAASAPAYHPPTRSYDLHHCIAIGAYSNGRVVARNSCPTAENVVFAQPDKDPVRVVVPSLGEATIPGAQRYSPYRFMYCGAPKEPFSNNGSYFKESEAAGAFAGVLHAYPTRPSYDSTNWWCARK